jgi:hypothetical protein
MWQFGEDRVSQLALQKHPKRTIAFRPARQQDARLMYKPQSPSLKRRITVLFMLICGISIIATSSSMAAPYTAFFGPLITTLSNRVAVLNNQTDKASVTQKNAILKDLAVLGKTSTSEATDLRNAILIAKSLAKSTPDYATTFHPILENIFIGFYNDTSNLVTSVQNTISAMPDTSCKTKAQAALNLAVAAISSLSPTDFAAFSKALISAGKNGLKAQTLAISSSCTGSGGSDTVTMTVNGTSWTASNGSVGAGYGSSTHELDFGGQEGNASSLSLVLLGLTGTGTFSNSMYGSYTVFNAATYSINSGTVTITTFDIAHNTIAGTFSFSASSGSSIVTVTQGSFDIKHLSVH